MYLPVTVAWQRSLATRSTCLSGLLPISRTMPRVLLPARSSLTHSHAPSVSTVKEKRISRGHTRIGAHVGTAGVGNLGGESFSTTAPTAIPSTSPHAWSRNATPNYVLRSLATVTINAQIRSHVHPRAVDHGCTELHEVPAVVRLLSIIRLNCIGASLHLAHQKRSGIAELLVLGFGLARPGVGLGSPAVAPRLHTAQLL